MIFVYILYQSIICQTFVVAFVIFVCYDNHTMDYVGAVVDEISLEGLDGNVKVMLCGATGEVHGTGCTLTLTLNLNPNPKRPTLTLKQGCHERPDAMNFSGSAGTHYLGSDSASSAVWLGWARSNSVHDTFGNIHIGSR